MQDTVCLILHQFLLEGGDRDRVLDQIDATYRQSPTKENKHNHPQTDAISFQLMKDELFTAVVGDVLDAAGYTHQFLPAQIKALDPAMLLVGRALPVLEADC